MKDALVAEFGPYIGYTKLGRDEVVISNFPDPDTGLPAYGEHDDFVDRVEAAIDAHTVALGIREAGTVWAEGNYLTHDWVKDPKGKELLNGIKRSTSKSSVLHKRLDSWRKLYEGSLDRYRGAELDQRIKAAEEELERIKSAGVTPRDAGRRQVGTEADLDDISFFQEEDIPDPVSAR